jgi:glycosyltransferase involved in cell wall biosynthesis
MRTKKKISKLRIAFVVPHIFMNDDILPNVIFSPGHLALDMTAEMTRQGADVTLFTPGPTITDLPNITADLSYFDQELAGRKDGYLDLLKKHTFTFITLARQVQAELTAKAYEMANAGLFDVVHVYTNEEDMALTFARFCSVPVVFTHHDPYNFFIKYKSLFPKYKDLNYISMSLSQRAGMPEGTHWVGNVYHGLNMDDWQPRTAGESDYVAYLGRIIPEKGVVDAIEAVNEYNKTAAKPLKLKIAGKHYAGHAKDTYWAEEIEPRLGGNIEYVGHISDQKQKNDFVAGAKALIVPSKFSEPFGLVTIEALACGTPVIGSPNGATPEIITDGVTGYIVESDGITLGRMASEHIKIYHSLQASD